MAGSCAALLPDDPLVRGLLGVVDCNVGVMAHTGYSALFQANSPLSGMLTALLTLYVALIGYRLMTGRSQLSVSDFAINAVKLGAVLALATQWDTYQTLVYGVLFRGPQQLAGGMLGAIQPDGSIFHGDVFDGLQTAFDDLSGFGAGFAAHSSPTASPMLGGPGFGAVLMTASAGVLLLSSLGVLLAAKIVLGLLLAVGPLFIAMLLFDATRGVFEGWLRASLAFAFAPLASTLLLGVALAMLEPSLGQMEALQKAHIYSLGPAYSVALLILVFAGVSAAALVAAGMIASGFRLPARHRAAAGTAAAGSEPIVTVIDQPRAARVAAAAAALDRRDASMVMTETRASDRRTVIAGAPDRGVRLAAEPERLGQQPQRRPARPRTPRPGAPQPSARSAR